MSVTVREVLELDVLRKAGARVVAGADGLDRPLRWVHIAEIADIASLIKGGELLLTTGMGIDSSPAAQRRYMTEIADAGAVGLVVELGRMFTSLPPAMVQVAQRRGFPLIALERATRYIEVTEAVHRAIVSDQYTLLRQAEEISRDFTDLILEGAGIGEIVARLASILGNAVVLEDAAGNLIEQAGRVRLWEDHARLPHTSAASGRVQQSSSCVWVSIWLRHQMWGRVHVLETGRPLDEITRLVLDLRKYGPEGSILIDAAMGDCTAATPFLIAAAVINSTTHETAILLSLYGAEFLFFAIAFVRFVQGSREGERFRATRPRRYPGRPLD
jgi:purine catabolism regulator